MTENLSPPYFDDRRRCELYEQRVLVLPYWPPSCSRSQRLIPNDVSTLALRLAGSAGQFLLSPTATAS